MLLDTLLSLDHRQPHYLGTSLNHWPGYHHHFTGMSMGFSWSLVGVAQTQTVCGVRRPSSAQDTVRRDRQDVTRGDRDVGRGRAHGGAHGEHHLPRLQSASSSRWAFDSQRHPVLSPLRTTLSKHPRHSGVPDDLLPDYCDPHAPPPRGATFHYRPRSTRAGRETLKMVQAFGWVREGVGEEDQG
jgi:hypothetical protein